MILKKLTATFGKLDHETLELREGLNVLSAPNEWGKSTWSAFLLAMFYGVDTSERTRGDRLAVKDKYAPWSGKAMSGSMELTWQGRNITIQRTTRGRIPLGVFEAFDTDTGEKLTELTAENCGVTLLGAERDVFVRSAFIGQAAITVDRSAELEKRLHSLASTGEETVSCSDTLRRLRDWENHVLRGGTGSISKAERALAEVDEKRETIRAQHDADLQLAERKGALEARERELQHICDCLRAGELLKRRAQLDAAERDAGEKRQAADAAQKAAAALPDEDALLDLDDRFDRLAADRAAFRREGEGLSATPPEPPCSPVFSGSTPEEAQRRAQTDADEVRRLQTPVKRSLLWIAAFAAVLCGVACVLTSIILRLDLLRIVGIAVFGVGIVLLIVWAIIDLRKKRAWEANREAAGQILRNYRADSADEILAAAVRYGEALRQYEKEVEEIREKWRARNEELSRLDKEEKELLAALHVFSPETDKAEDTKQAIRQALSAIRDAEKAATAAEAAESKLRALRETFGELPEVAPPQEDFTDRWRPDDAQRELGEAQAQLAQIGAALAESRGRVEACGDPAALEAEREALTERIAALRKRGDALVLAQAALGKANLRMQARFSPQLSQLAGEYLSAMTDKRYEKLLLDQDFRLTAKAADEDAAHPLLALSGGTAEQVYFALRLAICTLALEKDVPIVLDDAFVFFDDKRLAQAMMLLKQEAETRQILLFTCQSREQSLAE